MAIYGTLNDFRRAIDAVIPPDASPLQDGDITQWNPIRQKILDMVESYLDSTTMRTVVGDASSASTSGLIPGEAVVIDFRN